jgi:LacI family transcriptional regulator
MAPIRICLVLDHSLGYCRAVFRGIQSFAESRPNWLLTLVPPNAAGVKRLRSLRPAGVIAYVFNRSLGDSLLRLRRPLVNVSALVADFPAHRVVVDDRMVGRMAAAHLLDRGLRNFGFVGHAQLPFSTLREEGFRGALRAAGFTASSFLEPGIAPASFNSLLWPSNSRLDEWLTARPKPVGIFVPSDTWGYQLLEICRRLGLSVPDELAMVGVEVDGFLGEFARPPLTSLALPAERIGKQAAAVLDRLLVEPQSMPASLLLPPLGVVTRQSTDMLAVGDVEVAAAVRFIRERGLAPIQVNDVLRAVPIARRALERRFRATLGRGIGQEIRRVRIEQARFLLATTDCSMSEVAQRSGMSDAKQLSAAFHKQTGQTPTTYRRECRTSNGRIGLSDGCPSDELPSETQSACV